MASGFITQAALFANGGHIFLFKPGAVVGLVKDFDGSPLPHFPVVAFTDDGMFRITRTDKTGAFLCDGLPVIELLFEAGPVPCFQPRYRKWLSQRRSARQGRLAQVREGETIRHDIELNEIAARLQGLVAINGEPASGVTITAWDTIPYRNGIYPPGVVVRTTTSEGGQFEFPVLPSLPYAVQVSRHDRPLSDRSEVDLVPGRQADVVFNLLVGAVEGRVLEIESAPGSGPVFASLGDRTVLVDQLGRFAFRDLRPGPYRFLVNREGAFSPPQTVSVTGTVNHPIEVRLVESRAVTLLVRWKSQWTNTWINDLSYLVPEVESQGLWFEPTALLGKGRVTLPHVPTGPFRFRLSLPDRDRPYPVFTSGELTTKADGPTVIDLRSED